MTHEEILQKMQELVGEQFAMEPAEVTMETAFEEDLGHANLLTDNTFIHFFLLIIGWVFPT